MKNLTYFREKLDTDVDPRMISRRSQSIKIGKSDGLYRLYRSIGRNR